MATCLPLIVCRHFRVTTRFDWFLVIAQQIQLVTNKPIFLQVRRLRIAVIYRAFFAL